MPDSGPLSAVPQARARTLSKDDAGSTVAEFAVALPALLTMIIGIMEIGAAMFVNTTMESALRDASRFGITGQGGSDAGRLEAIIQLLDRRTGGLLDINQAQVDTRVYEDFASVGQGETFTDANSNGQYDLGEEFTDLNGNGVFDDDIGTPGLGGSDEIVVYRLTFDWNVLTPFAASFIGEDGVVTLRASIAVKNEPFSGGAGAPVQVGGGL